ncbi:carbohydrate ABC transporter permease [Carnobacterium gallinarum]|uniref:carbohydrate ABC transporter permease n=1 Tax=Carnobacterium gallinarum TaxID=2749 RepID=UPI000B0828F8|nr:sugar ABC transporter permease [Carnobacterium gallinarum]
MKQSALSKRNRQKYFWAFILVAPTLLFVLIMNIWPIIQTFYFSLNQIKGLGVPKWIGFENYIKAFQDKDLASSIWNTAIYTVVTVPIGTFLSLITAVFLNTKIKGKSFFRVLYFIPVVSAPAAIAMVWRWLYNSDYGLINYLLSLIGINGPNWIGDSHFVLIAVMIVGIWSGVGYNMIILLGGLQDIPKSYYEAAEIDGASSIRKFFSITLPMLSPTLFFVVTTSFIGALQVFDLIFMMVDKANPAIKSAQSIVYLFYRATFVNNDKGYGAAIAIILLVIIMFCTFIQMQLQKKWVHYR